MDLIESGITLKMQQVPYINSVIATPGSLVNSAITNYTFLITPSVPLNNSYSVLITFPPEITQPNATQGYGC